MKRYIVLLLVLIPVVVYAAGALVKDRNTVPVQGHAPVGTATEVINTKFSTTINMSERVSYSIFSETTSCRVRTMATASTTNAGVKYRVPTSQWHTDNVNPATPFLNLTACANPAPSPFKSTYIRKQ